MLVSIEKKKFIFNEYVEERTYTSAYDLTMELLDSSYCEQGDINEMIEICKFCLSEYYPKDFNYLTDDVKYAHNDWVENNYQYL
tara:strand:+ start:2827 stop:3078 length:252 start_codon:yes stop_codon:yes gene_type:complete